jgi:hypothetical protein
MCFEEKKKELISQKPTSSSSTRVKASSALFTVSAGAFAKQRSTILCNDLQYSLNAGLPYLWQVPMSSGGVLLPSSIQKSKISWYTVSIIQKLVTLLQQEHS